MPRAPFPSGRKLLLLFALAAAIIGGAWWSQRPPPDPVYEGQRLAEWLDKAANENRTITAGELHAFGPGVLRWLTYTVEHGQSPFYQYGPLPFDRAPDWLRRWVPERWGGRHGVSPRDDLLQAIYALRILGPEAAPATPALVGLVERMSKVLELQRAGRESLYVNHAAGALHGIGPASWPAVRRILERGNPYARGALLALMQVRLSSVEQPASEADVAEVIATLVQACDDPQAPVRAGAAAGIGWCRKKRPDLLALDAAIPHVIRLLADPDSTVRYSAAQWLGECGAKAPPVIPRLIELLDDKDPGVRERAAASLGILDTEEKRSEARLRVMLQDSHRGCAAAAAKALKALGLEPTAAPR